MGVIGQELRRQDVVIDAGFCPFFVETADVVQRPFPRMGRPMRLIVLSLLLSVVSAAPLMAAESASPAAATPLVIGETELDFLCSTLEAAFDEAAAAT